MRISDWSSDVCSSDLLDVADQREVLAERMADEPVVGQDPAQVRMALEDDAEQVERLALEPVRAGPQVGDRGHDRQVVVAREAGHRHEPVVTDRTQLRDPGEATLRKRGDLAEFRLGMLPGRPPPKLATTP